MSGRGRISIITVVRNGVGCLEETIHSVVGRDSALRLDYLIIDGGSTDGTVEIIKKYADRLHYWVSEQDAGTYDAMNKGWAAAADDSFILFLGAGDRLISLPDAIACRSPQHVVYGSVLMGERAIFKARADFHLKLYNSLHHQALLVHKSVHPVPPFDCRYRLYADFDFNQRLKKTGINFVHAPEFLSYARPGGLSDAPDFPESLRVIEKNYGWFWKLFAVTCFVAIRVFSVLGGLRPKQKL